MAMQQKVTQAKKIRRTEEESLPQAVEGERAVRGGTGAALGGMEDRTLPSLANAGSYTKCYVDSFLGEQ
jgi:hypothetical protein